MTINTELANDIATIIGMRPGNHDQSNWFYVYDGKDADRLTPDDIHIVELLAEAKQSEEKGIDYQAFEPEVSCSATLCVAGWACILNGYTLLEDEHKDIVAEKDGEVVPVQKKGAELLGIDTDVANWLFCSTDNNEAEDALADMSNGNIPDGYIEYTDAGDSYCCEHCSGY